MSVQLRRVGDHFFLALDAVKLEALSIDESTPLELAVEEGQLVVRRVDLAPAVEPETVSVDPAAAWLDRTAPSVASNTSWHGREEEDEAERTLPSVDFWTESDSRSAFFRGRRS